MGRGTEVVTSRSFTRTSRGLDVLKVFLARPAGILAAAWTAKYADRGIVTLGIAEPVVSTKSP